MNVTQVTTLVHEPAGNRGTWMWKSNELMWRARDLLADALATLPPAQFSGANSVSRGSADEIRCLGARYAEQVRIKLTVSKATGGWILAVDAVTDETPGALLELVTKALEAAGLPFYVWKFVWERA
jgi:hypothetical protein